MEPATQNCNSDTYKDVGYERILGNKYMYDKIFLISKILLYI